MIIIGIAIKAYKSSIAKGVDVKEKYDMLDHNQSTGKTKVNSIILFRKSLATAIGWNSEPFVIRYTLLMKIIIKYVIVSKVQTLAMNASLRLKRNFSFNFINNPI